MFLIGYLDYEGAQDFARIILNVHSYDRMGYLGRELAYLLGYPDALFIRLCALAGLPHFFSLLHCLSLLAVSLIHYAFSRKFLKATPFIISLLFLLLFLTSPVAVFSFGFLLPGQSVATVFGVLSLWMLVKLSKGREGVWPSGIKMFLAALPLPFLGPQGVFFLTSMAGLVSLYLVMRRRPPWLRGVWWSLAAVGVLFAGHKFFLGPWLISQASGCLPISAAGPFDILEYLANWCFYMNEGFQVLAGTMSRFFGGYGQWAGVAFGIACLIPWFLKTHGNKENSFQNQHIKAEIEIAFIMAAGILLLILMNSLILSHRPDILQCTILKIVRYWLTASGCILVAASLSANRFLEIFPRTRKLLPPILAILVLSNVFSLLTRVGEFRQEVDPSFANRSHEALESLRFPQKPLFCFNLDQSEQYLSPPPATLLSDSVADWPLRDQRSIYRACRMLRAPAGYESGNFAGMERILAGQRRFVTLEPLQPAPWNTMTEYLLAAKKYRPHVVVAPLPAMNISPEVEATRLSGIPLLAPLCNIWPDPNTIPPGNCAGWFVLFQDPENKDIGLLVFLNAAADDADNLLTSLNKNGISCQAMEQDPFVAASLESYINTGDAAGLTLFLGLQACYVMLERRIGCFEGALEGIGELGRKLFSQQDYPNAAMCLEIAWAMNLAEARDLSIAGGIYHSLGYPAKARALLFQAFEAKPQSMLVLNNFAWFLATTPDPALADGEKAVRIASALRETSPNNSSILDTLAAAQARTGQFTQAVETAEKCLKIVREQNDSEFLSQIIERIHLYKNNIQYQKRRSVHGL
ncbi:MAG: hypothetical protein JEZ02_09500 [Desulfatibacillum sp.]|nr:hypothetical protein [Desulfatibacillum sp.]